jgi:peptidoglycan/xylan/chitin deacetylase (PgdA/CDA1 family)
MVELASPSVEEALFQMRQRMRMPSWGKTVPTTPRAERGDRRPSFDDLRDPVDATHLPDPSAFPRLNPDADIHRAWLTAEGPRRTVDEPHRLVTLTFDDGPFPETTPTVLRLLAKHNVRATFFLIGRYLDGLGSRAIAARQVAKLAHDAGHLIGNHSHDHLVLSASPRSKIISQIDRGARSIERAIGEKPFLFRPPYGQLNGEGEHLVRERGLELVLWNVEVADMRRADVDAMTTSLKNQLEYAGGGIVLLHDIRPSSIKVLAKLLAWLEENRWNPMDPERPGFEVVDLATYMRATAGNPQPFDNRTQLELARRTDWKTKHPKNHPPAVMFMRTEGHDFVL